MHHAAVTDKDNIVRQDSDDGRVTRRFRAYSQNIKRNASPMKVVERPAPVGSGYYLRALAIHGFHSAAERLATDLEQGYLEDRFTTGIGDGNEFMGWDGLACGYEGTFGPNFGALQVIAIQRGTITPPSPEWWPA